MANETYILTKKFVSNLGLAPGKYYANETQKGFKVNTSKKENCWIGFPKWLVRKTPQNFKKVNG